MSSSFLHVVSSRMSLGVSAHASHILRNCKGKGKVVSVPLTEYHDIKPHWVVEV
jgi:hypothetical protein